MIRMGWIEWKLNRCKRICSYFLLQINLLWHVSIIQPQLHIVLNLLSLAAVFILANTNVNSYSFCLCYVLHATTSTLFIPFTYDSTQIDIPNVGIYVYFSVSILMERYAIKWNKHFAKLLQNIYISIPNSRVQIISILFDYFCSNFANCICSLH